jgi:hypothetical protein
LLCHLLQTNIERRRVTPARQVERHGIVGHPTDRDQRSFGGRASASDRAFWFLGPARYESHEGERPIAITWKLEQRLPADLFTEFVAAAAA